LGATIQTHLFEDRVMKADHLKIGEGCSVGNMAVILYGTEMLRGSSIGPLSVLMKGEVLPAFSRWVGIPTRPLDALPVTRSPPAEPAHSTAKEAKTRSDARAATCFRRMDTALLGSASKLTMQYQIRNTPAIGRGPRKQPRSRSEPTRH
jgi:hypothetical protein